MEQEIADQAVILQGAHNATLIAKEAKEEAQKSKQKQKMTKSPPKKTQQAQASK